MSNGVLFGLVYIDIVFATRVAPVCVSSFVWKSLFCFTKRAVVWLVLVGLDIFFDDFELPAFTRFLQQNSDLKQTKKTKKSPENCSEKRFWLDDFSGFKPGLKVWQAYC